MVLVKESFDKNASEQVEKAKRQRKERSVKGRKVKEEMNSSLTLEIAR